MKFRRTAGYPVKDSRIDSIKFAGRTGECRLMHGIQPVWYTAIVMRPTSWPKAIKALGFYKSHAWDTMNEAGGIGNANHGSSRAATTVTSQGQPTMSMRGGGPQARDRMAVPVQI
jgi:hypothetical protein